jgi:adenine deaminase
MLLRGCSLVNVYSGEIYQTDIAIAGDRIDSISPQENHEADEVLDCQGLFAVPGFVDPHMHVDTTLLWPGELARLIVPHGTTTVFVDTTNIITTGGVGAVRALLDSFAGLPLRGFISAPSYSPFEPGRETVAHELTLADLELMLSWPECVGIGETVSSKILAEDESYLARIDLCQMLGKRVSGHGGDLPGGNEAAMDAYASVGISDDHCVMAPSDVAQRLRRGVAMFTVETSGRNYLTGGLLVTEIVDHGPGYLDRLVRLAIAAGVEPMDAVRMATLNTAVHYGMAGSIGSITPGRLADILLVRALDQYPPEVVIVNGEVVARSGELIADLPPPDFPPDYRNSLRLKQRIDASAIELPAPGGKGSAKVRVIRVEEEDPAFNTGVLAELPVVEGLVRADPGNDVLKMCVVERYGRAGSVAIGFVQGFGLKRGAMATSVSVPSNNIVAVGTNDPDILRAISALEAMQGGYVVVDDGAVLAEVPLPIGGVMADRPYEEIVEMIRAAEMAVRDKLGGVLLHPFGPLTHTVLCSLPELGMTDQGLMDVASGEFIPVIVEAAASDRPQPS